MANRDQYEKLTPFVETQRTRAELDEIFDFGGTLNRDDVKVKGGTNTATVMKTGYLDDEEFEAYKTQAKESDALQFTGNGWSTRGDQLDAPYPERVHEHRPQSEQRRDENRRARLTTDVEKWAEHPDHFDYPYVDTPNEVDEQLTVRGPTDRPKMTKLREAAESDEFVDL